MNTFRYPNLCKPGRGARTIVRSLIVAAVLAGCGGSSKPVDHTASAATCLRNALANQALHGGTNCGDSTTAKVLNGGSGTKITVTCTHQNGNEYICDAKVPVSDGINLTGVKPGFYQVTYDGKSIVFQQTQ